MRLRSAVGFISLAPLIIVTLHTLVRVVRHFHKFPIPQFLANAIDNPLRRRLQPPVATAIRHGLQPGMRVLDIGPGNGRYSMVDPDYPLAQTLLAWAGTAGLWLKQQVGGFFYYTLIFER